MKFRKQLLKNLHGGALKPPLPIGLALERTKETAAAKMHRMNFMIEDLIELRDNVKNLSNRREEKLQVDKSVEVDFEIFGLKEGLIQDLCLRFFDLLNHANNYCYSNFLLF